jgi:predicted nucleotidyltransferase
VLNWCKNTFTTIYYLEKLPYVDDGARLDEKGRDAADFYVHQMFLAYSKGKCVGGSGMPRENVVTDILKQVSHVLTAEQLQLVPKVLGVNKLLIGGSYAFNRQTKKSDVDIYLSTTEPIETGNPYFNTLITRFKDVFGVPVEIRGVVPAVYEYLKSEGFVEYRA